MAHSYGGKLDFNGYDSFYNVRSRSNVRDLEIK